MTVVEVDGVSFGYGGPEVLSEVSLSVEAGEFLGLVGPNGSGKSTLLRLMLGLERPDEGTVRLFGEPAHRVADGRRVGYVAQDAATPTRMPVTVRELVGTGRVAHVGFGRATREDREAVDRALARVDVADLAGRRLNELSGGQRQRAYIARALAAEADLLALDEPTVGVDAASREAFYDLLADLNDDGLTVLLVEHDIGVVTAHADRVACLDRRLHFHGDAAALLDSDALATAYGTNQQALAHDHR